MRIALVSQDRSPTSGPGHVVRELAHGLAGRGHEVEVVTAVAAGLDVTRVGIHHVASWRDAGGVGFAWAATRRLKRLRPELVYAMGACCLNPDAVNLQSVRPARREALAAAGVEVSGGPGRLALRLDDWRERRSARKASRLVVAPSLEVRAEIAACYGVAAERIAVVPNGVDGKRFSPAAVKQHRDDVRHQMGFTPETPLALIVGRNFAASGVGLATEILSRLAKLRLLVVGGDEETFRAYRDLAYAQGTAERLYHIAETDLVAPYYAAADIFLQLSAYAGHSLSLLEAAASGLAIVAARTGGVQSVVEDGVSGFLVDRAIAAASEAVARLVDDQPRRAAMGRAAHEKSLAYGWEAMVERSETLLMSILAARRGGAPPAASPTPPG